ncbi:MAG: YHYH protein [Ornithinibacter sp.]
MRTIVTNALPDTETGTFPNEGNPNSIAAQDNTYVFTAEPTFVGEATPVRTTGIAINGVKFEPGTAETITCDSGEVYRVEALQDDYNLGLDFNNAHVQPDGEYHYHGVSELMVDVFDAGEDLVHVGFAADGYLMYYSLSGAYRPSYKLSTEPAPVPVASARAP